MVKIASPFFFIMKKKLFLILFLFLANTASSQLFTEIIKTIAFDREAEDRLGYAVDISGNYAIVGAYGDDFGALNPNMGSAYIFEKTGIEDWTFVQKINSSDQDDYDRFGWSVAINGNYLVVGAYAEDEDEDDSNTLSKAGSAYIFERDSIGVWLEVQKIVASDRDTSDEFGWTVDISEATIIVGAHHEGHDELGGDFIFKSGSVYAFDRGLDGVWSETQKIVAWDRQPDSGGGDETINIWHYQDIDYGDLFGCSIGLSGDFMIVGAHNGDFNADGFGGVDQAGAAYIFQRIDGVWENDQKVCATVRGGWDRYGYSVDIDSTVAVVGAKAEDESEFEAAFLHNAGSAYIYQKGVDGVWTTVQKIDASDRGVGDHFGIDVAIDGNYLVVGAESNNFDEASTDELNNAGAAYIFEKSVDDTWSEIQKIDASDRVLEDWFGNAVAISDHTILIGAWQQDFNELALDSIEDAGAAYFFSSLLCSTDFVEQTISICEGEVYTVGLSTYVESGIYIDTLLNHDACDSVVTTNLTVHIPSHTDTSVVICFGDIYSVGISTYSETGLYTDTLISPLGCDSIIVTDLFVYADNTTEQLFNICPGDEVIVGDTSYSETGVYTTILTAETGCDSTVITTIEMSTPIDVTVTVIDLTTLSSNEPTGGSTSYQWVNCDTWEPLVGATLQNYEATENGNYAVIISKDFCSDTSACFLISSVGIVSFKDDNCVIYPNPSSGIITLITTSELVGSQLVVYNAVGQLIYEITVSTPSMQVDLSNFEKGIYYIHLSNGQKASIKRITLK